MTARAIAACVASLLIVAAACGSDDSNANADDTNDGDRPTTEAIVSTLLESADGDLREDVARCAAVAMVESDVPNGRLRALVEDREPRIENPKRQQYNERIRDARISCAVAFNQGRDLSMYAEPLEVEPTPAEPVDDPPEEEEGEPSPGPREVEAPPAEDIAPVIEAEFGPLPAGVADCWAEAIVDSELPMWAVVDALEGREVDLPPEDVERYAILIDELGRACATGAGEG